MYVYCMYVCMYVCIERNDCTHWALIHYKFDELLIYHLGLETLALISLTLLVYCTVLYQVRLPYWTVTTKMK